MSKRELAAAISEFMATFESDVVPNGWLTTYELGDKLGVKDRQAYNIAVRFMKAGHADKKTFRIKVGCFIRPVPHYKFSKKAERAMGLTKPKPRR
jgi:hypothetical protein